MANYGVWPVLREALMALRGTVRPQDRPRSRIARHPIRRMVRLAHGRVHLRAGAGFRRAGLRVRAVFTSPAATRCKPRNRRAAGLARPRQAHPASSASRSMGMRQSST